MSIYGEVSPGLEGSVKVGATTEITTPLYKIGVSFGPPTPLPEGPDLIDQAISGLFMLILPLYFLPSIQGRISINMAWYVAITVHI